MGLRESDKKQVRVVLVMVLALAAPAMLLYLLYVNSQRDYFTDRNLRLLSVVSKQLATGIGNYQNVFTSLVDSVKRAAKGDSKGDSAEASKAPGTVVTATGSAPPAGRSSEADRDPGRAIQENLYRSNMSLRPRMQTVADSQAAGLTPLPKQGSSTRIKLVSEQSGYWLYMLYDGSPDRSQPGFHIYVKVNVSEVAGQFIGKDAWDGADEFDD